MHFDDRSTLFTTFVNQTFCSYFQFRQSSVLHKQQQQSPPTIDQIQLLKFNLDLVRGIKHVMSLLAVHFLVPTLLNIKQFFWSVKKVCNRGLTPYVELFSTFTSWHFLLMMPASCRILWSVISRKNAMYHIMIKKAS